MYHPPATCVLVAYAAMVLPLCMRYQLISTWCCIDCSCCALQVLISLDYIHRKLGIIHTDLKPENVMLTATVREPKQRPPSAASKPSDAAPNGKSHVHAMLSYNHLPIL